MNVAFPWWEGNLGAVSGVRALMPCQVCLLVRQCLSGEGQSPKAARRCCVTLQQGAEDTEWSQFSILFDFNAVCKSVPVLHY